MNSKKTFTKSFTKKISDLSKISLEEDELSYFTEQFNNTLSIIGELSGVNTKGVKGAYNVTSLKNVFREDEVNSTRILSQEQALSNSKRTYKGFFVVKGVFEK